MFIQENNKRRIVRLQINGIPDLNVDSCGRIMDGDKILPGVPGVYIFWWIGSINKLLKSNTVINVRGPGKHRVKIVYTNWWEPGQKFPCLYVGKTTNLKKRFALHIKGKTKGRYHRIPISNQKHPKTSSCQLRYGIEHIFRDKPNPLEIIAESVGYSYFSPIGKQSIVDRFFLEDKLIGHLKPWFNIDSER